MIKYLKSRLYKWTERNIKIKIEPLLPLIRPGTGYGGWIIPENFLHKTSVVYLVGAGEDVSFDADVARQYGCRVHIVDPTPRAVEHVRNCKITSAPASRRRLRIPRRGNTRPTTRRWQTCYNCTRSGYGTKRPRSGFLCPKTMRMYRIH